MITGTIFKTHKKSWFKRFNLTSPYAEKLFVDGGYKFENNRAKYEEHGGITILQMIICGEMEVIAELVYTKDYEHEIQ